jgi:hypothetical protein
MMVVKSSADPFPMTLHDQLKLSRLETTHHQKTVGPGHRKAYSEFDIATLSTSIIVEGKDFGGAVEEPSSPPHPFFRKNAEWEPTSPTSTSVVPGEFDGVMQSLSTDSPDRRRAKNHRRNKSELPFSFTSTPSTTAASVTSPFKTRSNSLALDEDDLRKLVRQLELIIESQAEEIQHLQDEVDEWKARAQAHQP